MRRTATMILLITGTLVLTSPADAGGGGCHQPEPTLARATTVAMSQNCFTATVTWVEPGDLVTFVNGDGWAHTVTGASLTWGSPANLGAGERLTHRFLDAGVYPYVCLLHPAMVGAVVVGDGGGDAAEPATPVAAPADVSGPGSPVPTRSSGALPVWIAASGLIGAGAAWALGSGRSRASG